MWIERVFVAVGLFSIACGGENPSPGAGDVLSDAGVQRDTESMADSGGDGEVGPADAGGEPADASDAGAQMPCPDELALGEVCLALDGRELYFRDLERSFGFWRAETERGQERILFSLRPEPVSGVLEFPVGEHTCGPESGIGVGIGVQTSPGAPASSHSADETQGSCRFVVTEGGRFGAATFRGTFTAELEDGSGRVLVITDGRFHFR